MRISRNPEYLPVLLINFFSIASRVGLIASSWILLVNRFEINPILSAIMSMCVQGFIVAMNQISKKVTRNLSLLNTQRLGAIVGALSCLALLIVSNLVLFLTVVLFASFSKVLIESTFPRVTHRFLRNEKKFSSILMGTQQGSVLFVSLIIAPIAIFGNYDAPIVVTSALYFIALLVTVKFPSCADDNFEEVIQSGDSQAKFDRRFSDIAANENIRSRQSKIHKFRRIPSTLMTLDLSVQIAGGASMVLMPLCFIQISNVSQGMDSVLCFIFGLAAAITGLYLFPKMQSRVSSNERAEWIFLLVFVSVMMFSCVTYITFFGVFVALVSAFVNGFSIISYLAILHTIAARNLDQVQYQEFGCKIMQRNALARITAPIVVGGLANITSLSFAVYSVFIFLGVLAIANAARVILILNGRKLDERAVRSIESIDHSARKLRSNRRSRNDVDQNDKRAFEFLSIRYSLRPRIEFSSSNRVGVGGIETGTFDAFPQKDSFVDAARRAPR